jgi:murein DD-endopeptidase MepM/ murein hydrolase activator NlpD
VTTSNAYLGAYDTLNGAETLLNITFSGSSGTPTSSTSASGAAVPNSSGFIMPEGKYRFPESKFHHDGSPAALDFGADMGTPVFSPWSGYVRYIGYPEGGEVKKGATPDFAGGNTIVIVGDNGHAIYMCHFMSPPIVEIGDRVELGQNVAFCGSTGRSTGPHVHVSVARSANYADVWSNPIRDLWDFMKGLEQQAQATNAAISSVRDNGLGLRV